MQPSKITVNLEVKQVIGTLCKLLSAVGLYHVPAPEAFRRAKFGFGVEMESQFWRLIADILHSSGTVHSQIVAQPKEEYKKLVAAGLWQTGYYADWIYEMEEEGQDEKSFSSQDLLLAVGWLLSIGTIEKLLMQRVQQLDKTLLRSIPVSSQVSQELWLDLVLLRRLQWLVGNLRHEGRILLCMLEEKNRLLHAFFSASVSSKVPYLSDQNSTALKNDYVCTEQLCDLLEAYVNWKQDSVIGCHLSEPKRCTSVPDMVSSRNQGLEELENMLIKLPIAQKGQRRGRGDSEERGRTNLQEGLDTSPCLPISLPLLPSFSHSYRARLQAEKPVRLNRYPSEELHNWAKTTEDFQPSKTAWVLLETEAQLLQRRDQQRQANRMMLQHTISLFDAQNSQ
ncbi:uncharacterized protein tedc1 isoform X2 [Betta splendens]|uniref:Uncharacterized protein tedc1 isoform X2 n=1 Tax=Betta splendens TaxID=158456 RepID=A0A6P7LLT0_BETSP|nr:uncharacterized protein tedc1 isoform X2 [Betta splendens]